MLSPGSTAPPHGLPLSELLWGSKMVQLQFVLRKSVILIYLIHKDTESWRQQTRSCVSSEIQNDDNRSRTWTQLTWKDTNILEIPAVLRTEEETCRTETFKHQVRESEMLPLSDIQGAVVAVVRNNVVSCFGFWYLNAVNTTGPSSSWVSPSVPSLLSLSSSSSSSVGLRLLNSFIFSFCIRLEWRSGSVQVGAQMALSSPL